MNHFQLSSSSYVEEGATVIVLDVTRLPSALWATTHTSSSATNDAEVKDHGVVDLDAMAAGRDEFTEQLIEVGVGGPV